MAVVKVWNRNTFPHTEKFKGKTLTIAPGKFIEMEAGDALLFKSAFSPIRVDKNGMPTKESRKMIEVEGLFQPSPSGEVHKGLATSLSGFVCQFDGRKFATQEELDSYIELNHADKIVVDEDAERAMQAREGVKRGPGRPRKSEQTA